MMTYARWIGASCLLGGMLVLGAGTAFAGPDNYVGDTTIYGGSTVDVEPNVLVILDTSGSMSDDVPVSSSTSTDICWEGDTQGACSADAVYECTQYEHNGHHSNCTKYRQVVSDVDNVASSCSYSYTNWKGHTRTKTYHPQRRLTHHGVWNNNYLKLNQDGTCSQSNNGGSYDLGSYVIAQNQNSSTTSPKIEIAQEVLEDLIDGTGGVNFGLMIFDQHNYDGGYFLPPPVYNNHYPSPPPLTYRTTVPVYPSTMEDSFDASHTNRQALLEMVQATSASGNTPLAETLFEAMRYFDGGPSAYGYNDGSNYTSPIAASCQQNYVVIITDGMPTDDNSSVLNDLGKSPDPVNTACSNGLCSGITDSLNDRLPDIAWYMHNTDLSSAYAGDQTVTTFTIGFGQIGSDADAVSLLQQTARVGGGKAFLASDGADLSSALQQIMGQIFQVDSSFVAPVVPISPENRTYSGNRVYLGFFRPQQNSEWLGNIKKFGLNASGVVVDANNVAATDPTTGAFKTSAVSYWDTSADGGKVDAGGVGQILADRSNPSPDLTPSSTTARHIYTNLTGTEGGIDLTDTSQNTYNQFSIDNTELTPAKLGLPAGDTADEGDLINYIYGIDVFDDNQNGSKTDNRDWVFGDVLHSRPVVVRYNNFDDSSYDSTAEKTCPASSSSWDQADTSSDENKTVIYAGSDDGMLHAFEDCDGQELWGFIPDNELKNLNDLHSGAHTYFQDSSPSTYVYDKNNDGVIDPADDKVVLIFGQRRGGGIDTLADTGSRGAYYALDVTKPRHPKLLWKIDNATVDSQGNAEFPELGETWSKPALVKMKIKDSTTGTTQDEIVAIFGAGYDNNEDLRFGDTQTFPTGTTEDTLTTTGSADNGNVTISPDGGTQVNPMGRGVYVVEVGYFDQEGAFQEVTTPTKVWGYTNDIVRTANNPTSSIPSDVAALDSNADGYVDTFYVGDTGGNMWRFSVGDVEPTNWTGAIIFSANDSTNNPTDVGRKIFYKPSVVIENGYKIVYFGTGDRPHSLNQAVVDRMYALKDLGQNSTKTESDMMDLTDDLLQATDSTLNTQQSTDLANLGEDLATYQQNTKTQLASSGNYGWYIKLNDNSGEKVLSSPLAYNKVVYFTTFTPNVVSTDPCQPGDLGASRLYALDYLDGGAIFNYDTSNDTNDSGEAVQVLAASDRSETLGVGIPSGIVLDFPKSGDARILVGSGGGLPSEDTTPGGRFFPLYWMQE